MAEALSLGLAHPLTIEAPYADVSKTDVIRYGVYQNGASSVHRFWLNNDTDAAATLQNTAYADGGYASTGQPAGPTPGSPTISTLDLNLLARIKMIS